MCSKLYTSTSFTATTTGLQLLIDQKWPPLLQKLQVWCYDEENLDAGLHALTGAQWPKLAVLDLSNGHLKVDGIRILASAHLPSLTAVNFTGNELLDDAIKELVQAPWPRSEILKLSCQEQFGAAAAAYLVQGEWPLLKTLDVSCSNVCIGQLLNGNWPALEDLSLMSTCGEEDAPAIIKERSGLAWPSLKCLTLGDGAIDDLGMAELTMAEWPCLESVCLIGLSAEKFAETFASCEWPALSRLELKEVEHADEGALMCTRLSKVHLPVLETLVISGCCLNAAAIAELGEAAWEILRHVSFLWCPIAAAELAQLEQAKWCSLHALDISWCALDFEAVSELSRGQWPLLHSLVVCERTEFYWPIASVKRLLDGAWPLLT